MAKKKLRIGYYAGEIARLTKCSEREAVVIEEIMRRHIFHSTLDWQTPEQFDAAAREGLAILSDFRRDGLVPEDWQRILDGRAGS